MVFRVAASAVEESVISVSELLYNLRKNLKVFLSGEERNYVKTVDMQVVWLITESKDNELFECVVVHLTDILSK